MTNRRRRWCAAIVAGLLTTAGALAVAPGAQAAQGSPAPDGLPKFYAVPSKLPSQPGKLIKSEKLDAPKLDGSAYRVMYSSENEQGEITAVTGVVLVPEGKAPKGGWPVVSWAHGTNGMADECAPSLKADGSALNAKVSNALLAKGWMVVASDYEGEGTPGLHPYIAGPNAARNTIDIVRASGGVKGADPSDQYVVWGHSQGGHTAMFVESIAADYAPDLTLDGVVAGAPPSQFNLLYDFLKTSDFKHYLLMAAGGLNSAYGDEDAPLDEILTPAGIELLDVLEQGCSDFVGKELADVSVDENLTGDPFDVPSWAALLQANDPQQITTPSDTPLLIIHGGEDEQIPTASSAILSTHFCGIGLANERWVYPGQRHSAVITPSFTDMVSWIDARFAGQPAGSVTPTGQADVEVTGC
jgi:dipeptidyl aminopeptidase/acylaminoacyl peptidase